MMMENMIKLFNYGYCNKCNYMKKNDTRIALFHLLPPQLCEDISEYNVYCYGCSKAKRNEKWVIEKGIALEISEIETSLYYFTHNKPKPFCVDSPKTVKVREMNEIIGFYENKDKLMNKVGKKCLKIITSF